MEIQRKGRLFPFRGTEEQPQNGGNSMADALEWQNWDMG